MNRRRLTIALAAASLLVCAVSIAAWIESYYTTRDLNYQSTTDHYLRWDVLYARGSIVWARSVDWCQGPSADDFWKTARPTPVGEGWSYTTTSPPPKYDTSAGFERYHLRERHERYEDPATSIVSEINRVAIPLWLPVTITAILPLWYVVNERWRQRARAAA